MKKLLLFVIATVLFFPTVAYANPTGWAVRCPDAIHPGGTGTCTVYIRGSIAEGFSLTNATLTPRGIHTSIVNMEAAAGWTVSGSGENLTLTATRAVNGETAALVVTLRLAEDWVEGQPCGIAFAWNGETAEGVIPVTPERPAVENPETGLNAVPYILIGGGAILALGAFYLATKKNKLYKI